MAHFSHGVPTNETIFVHAQPHPISLNRTKFDQYIADSGFFLGCSRDFWIVFATCTLGMTLPFLLMYACVSSRTKRVHKGSRIWDCTPTGQEDDSAEDSGEDEDVEGYRGFRHLSSDEDVPAPKWSHGFMQRMVFRADLNHSFAFAMDLSLRTAMMCAICSLGYWSSTWPFSEWNNHGWSMQYVVVIIAFTVYTSAGLTWSLACSGFVGTLLSVMNCIFMFSLYPDGVEEQEAEGVWSQARIFGQINFVVFFVLILALNFPTNARMFALSWQAYFTMCFLNPKSTVIYSSGFTDISLYGGAIGPLMGTVWGIILSILCPLLPQALGFEVMSALATAQEVSLHVAWQESHLWNRLLTSFASGVHNFEQQALGTELGILRDKAKLIDGSLADGWWECFDLGRCGRIRAYLGALKQVLIDQQTQLQQAFLAMNLAATPATPGTAGNATPELIVAVLPEMRKLARSASRLQCTSAWIAMSGTIDDQAQLALKEVGDETAAAQRHLAVALVAARQARGEALTEATVSQNAFAQALSSFAQTARDFADSLIEDEFPPGVGPMAGFIGGVKGLFTGCLSCATDSSFVLRSGISFLLAFHFGLKGILGIIPNWNSTPAGTIAYLLSNAGHTGSALKKNFDRFVGVGLGTMLGQLVYMAMVKVHNFAWNTTLPHLVSPTGFLMFLAFELAAYYVYFSGSSFSYVGLLIACFGAEHILEPVDGVAIASSDKDSEVYANMMGQFVAIVAAACMDNLFPRIILFAFAAGLSAHGLDALGHFALLVLAVVLAVILEKLVGNTPGSILAVDALDRFQHCLHEKLASVLHLEEDERSEDEEEVGSDGEALIGTMSDEGQQAAMEPRIEKLPWNEPMWAKLTDTCQQLWVSVQALASAASGEAYAKLLRNSKALIYASDRVVERSDETLSFAAEIMKHTTQAPLNVPLPSSFEGDRRTVAGNAAVTQASILAQANENIAQKGNSGAAPQTLLNDDVCTVSTILLMLLAINKQLGSLQESLLQVPGVLRPKV